MQNIKEQIKNKTVSGAYLIYGEENFLKDYYTARIEELCTMVGPKEFNCMKINSDKTDNDAIAEFIISMPFMADKKVLILKNSGIFSKANESTKKFWTEALSSLPDYMVVVFCESNIDKRSAIYKEILKNHTIEEFPLCKEPELINWFAKILKASGKSMTKDDISFVIENVGRNMYLLKSEAEKLISYTHSEGELISHDDVEKCICKSLEGKVFELIDNIITGKESRVIEGIRDLKTLSEQPVMIVSLIARQFMLLRKVKAFENEPVAQIASKTKLRDFVVRKNLSQLKRFTNDDLNNAIFLCNQTDESIKTGMCDSWLAVERLAILLMNKE